MQPRCPQRKSNQIEQSFQNHREKVDNELWKKWDFNSFIQPLKDKGMSDFAQRKNREREKLMCEGVLT